MQRIGFRIATLLALVFCTGFAGAALAQELEPRAYTPAPVKTNFLVIGYTHQTGSVFTDPTVPITDLKVRLDAFTMAYGRTFGLAGRQSTITFIFPYVLGNVTGKVFEAQREVTRSGGADFRMRLSTNLIGGPALTPEEFAKRKPTSTLGASVTVVVPTGQYDPLKLVNIGSNRWSFKPELGLSKPYGKWRFEATGGVWIFTPNGEYFRGATFEQRPVATVQGHVSYTFKPQLWVAASATFFGGGRTIVDGVEKNTLAKNSRIGAHVSLPVRPGQTLKISVAKGVTTRIGGDFTTFGVAYQYVWR
jgi:hypothetical protein